MGRKASGLGRSFEQAGQQGSRSTERLQVGLQRANVDMRQAEQRAKQTGAAYERATKLFGEGSQQAEAAALRHARAQVSVRESTLKVTEAQEQLSRSHERFTEHTDRAEASSRRLGRALDGDVTRGLQSAASAAGRTVGAFGLLAAATQSISLAPLLGLA